jgi:hypothetical protein
VCTTQNTKGIYQYSYPGTLSHPSISKALGPTDPAIDLESLGPLLLGPHDKTLFSMITPGVNSILETRPGIDSIVIFGIEVRFYTVPFDHVLMRNCIRIVSCLCPPNCPLPTFIAEIYPLYRDRWRFFLQLL